MTFYEFFSGGGMARAGLPGWTCLLANDNDPTKMRSYIANWGRQGTITADVASLTTANLPYGADLGPVDLGWISFPCQDLSEAGAGTGLDGWRSNAIWPCLDLIRASGVEGSLSLFSCSENVTGLLSPRSARFFDAICDALTDAGYRYGVMMIDAALFVPQSRERVFIVAVRKEIDIPGGLIAASPSLPFHSSSLVTAVRRQSAKPLWFNLPVPPLRNAVFADLIEGAPTGVSWHTQAETDRLLGMMSPVHLAKVEDAKRVSLAAGRKMVGGLYRRMRPGADGADTAGQRVQRAEVRFDDTAGCLRVPAGGSSRQTIMVVSGDTVRSRLISPRRGSPSDGPRR